MTRKATATWLSGMVPSCGALLMCPRESSEIARLSPMTQSRPAGTVTLNLSSDGDAPGDRIARPAGPR